MSQPPHEPAVTAESTVESAAALKPPIIPLWRYVLGGTWDAIRNFRPVQVWRGLRNFERWLVRYFGSREPRLRFTILPFLLLALVLYIRHPLTNYIFDEQEALLANPYVNSQDGLKFWDAFNRDFWGLPPNASIGSYRPIPNLIWRSTWQISEHPFFHHLYNILLHALSGSLLASFAFAFTRRAAIGWLSGAFFVCAAIITEAVSGIVGLADVLGGLGAILALCALRLPAPAMAPAVFAAITFGLFCKESALVCVPLVPVAALLSAPFFHRQQPARFARAALALVAAAAAFILYVELRRQWFPAPVQADLREALPIDASDAQQLYRDLLVWFQQAPLPRDPLNNPLAKADTPHRIAGALRVYWRGLVQVVAPLQLSGDYSFPQEPVPDALDEWESIAGGLMIVLPLAAALGFYVVALKREYLDRRRLLPAGDLVDAIRASLTQPQKRPGGRPQHVPLVALAPRGWGRRQLSVAALLIVPALCGFATEVWMRTQGSPSWVRTWPVLLLLFLVGSGFLVEGWRATPKPMDSLGAWPWRYVGLVLPAFAMVWVVISYFPHSNIPVVLPTVRADRFWYFPVIGTSLLLAVIFAWLRERLAKPSWKGLSLGTAVVAVFLMFQALSAYGHSMDYRDDLVFWAATKKAVPHSAKAHLNYSVMVGARGDLHTRLQASHVARELAPDWAMAHIYTGDTLCRLHRVHEAWPHYAKGFHKGPNDRSLIALALQCLHDEDAIETYAVPFRKLCDENPGTWLAQIGYDTLKNHKENKGVDPEYRPRSYNQKSKDKKKK